MCTTHNAVFKEDNILITSGETLSQMLELVTFAHVATSWGEWNTLGLNASWMNLILSDFPFLRLNKRFAKSSNAASRGRKSS